MAEAPSLFEQIPPFILGLKPGDFLRGIKKSKKP